MVARLLYRDGLMLVIDKPAGLAVHRGPKGGESLEDHFGALKFGLPRAPALAHRLDHDTSGCLVLGRHRKALASLGRLFKNGAVGKTYWAVVDGAPEADEGRIDLPLGRRDASRGWWMKHDPNGQPASTTWKVMGRAQIPVTSPWRGEVAERSEAGGGDDSSAASRFTASPHPGSFAADPPPQSKSDISDFDHLLVPNSGKPEFGWEGKTFTWLALEPLTGRTHQLRVHCAAQGWPITGDTIYGNAPRTGGPGLQLHAREVVVPLYKNRDPIRVSAPAPLHMHERLQACGWAGEVFTLVE